MEGWSKLMHRSLWGFPLFVKVFAKYKIKCLFYKQNKAEARDWSEYVQKLTRSVLLFKKYKYR